MRKPAEKRCHYLPIGQVFIISILLIGHLIACSQKPEPDSTQRQQDTPVIDQEHTEAGEMDPLAQEISQTPSTKWTEAREPERYRRLPAPLVPRSGSDQTAFLEEGIGIKTGSFDVIFDGTRWMVYPETGETALALSLPGGELNVLAEYQSISSEETGAGEQVILTGQTSWGDKYQAIVTTYNHHPGLLHYRFEYVPEHEIVGRPKPEWQFANRVTGEEAAGQIELYSDRAPMAAPHIYAYSEALDSTLFYWVDLTALNPFLAAAHMSPAGTPVRRGQRFGHNLAASDLRRQNPGEAVAVYDSYLYLEPGRPADEAEMFGRYLHNLGDIYDLMAVPEDPLPHWFTESDWDGSGMPVGIQTETIQELANPEHWVNHEEHRYLRAYISDTRETAELITQLDVYSALARWKTRFGQTPAYFHELRDGIPDFFNPEFGPAGMFQNSGPLSLTGSQGRGDTWYELGHALKVAELALWDPGDEQLRDLALRSGETWMAFAQAVGYHFPQFYSFETWQGTGREPDAAGGYAYFMLLLNEITAEERYLIEARLALQSLQGFGFEMAYETHMTAVTAAAAARLYQIDPDPLYLDVINQATANILRLSWLWESDYGFLVEEFDGNEQEGLPSISADVRQRTFFGLNPTQNSAAITPKEQYEAWIYVTETLQRLHDQLDPTVEKLLSEFAKHTLQTIPRSLPPFLPPGSATEFPAAYQTVAHNDLTIFIPLEDLRDGWEVDGVIGQEIYGAGMAPALAALSLVEVAPDIVVYSGYPLVDISGEEITFAGIPGTSTPTVVWGAESVANGTGTKVVVEPCGDALCFDAEGGASYRIMRGD